jgi:hypothetical protein
MKRPGNLPPQVRNRNDIKPIGVDQYELNTQTRIPSAPKHSQTRLRGHISPQDPTDEPASKLLARIRTAAGELRTITTDGKPAARRTRRSAATTDEEIEP